MGILDIFRRNKEPEKAIMQAYSPEYIAYQRGFDAATKDLIGEEWQKTGASYNEDVRNHFNKITRISRYMCTNNDYTKAMIKLIRNNVIGPNGFRINAEFKNSKGDILHQENLEIEEKFRAFSRHGVCDVSGRYSLAEISKKMLTSCMRDGGALLRLIYDRDINNYDFGLQYIPYTALDVDLNTDLPNGERIRMGVGLGKYDQVVAYYLKAEPSRHALHFENRPYLRIEADQMIHLYRSDYGEAYRDVSWFASSLIRMHLLEGMDQSTLQAVRSAASNMAFLIQRQKEFGGVDAEKFNPGKYKRKNLKISMNPLDVPMLPENIEKVEMFNPDQPKGTYSPFMKTQLRGVASGQGVSYNTYANDLESISYSSIRQRKLDDEDTYMDLQQWFKENVHEVIHKRFMINGHLNNLYSSRLIREDFNSFLYPNFEGRRWKAIDPLKEVKAEIEARDAGIKSTKRIMTERGYDPDAEQRQIISEQEYINNVVIKSGDEKSKDENDEE